MIVSTASLDWTQVLVVGIPAMIAAIFSGVAMVITAQNKRNLKPSNGRTIAETIESSHKLAEENATATAEVAENLAKKEEQQ